MWNGRRVEVYSVDVKGVHTLSAFDLVSPSMALYRTSIFAVTDAGVAVLNLQVGRRWGRWRVFGCCCCRRHRCCCCCCCCRRCSVN